MMRFDDKKFLAEQIRIHRKKAGLTQAELAEKVDIVPTYVSGIERGKSICSLAVAVKIAEELDLNLDHMIRGINISNAESTFSELLKNIPKVSDAIAKLDKLDDIMNTTEERIASFIFLGSSLP